MELRIVKNKKFFYSLFTSVKFNEPVLSGGAELGIWLRVEKGIGSALRKLIGQ